MPKAQLLYKVFYLRDLECKVEGLHLLCLQSPMLAQYSTWEVKEYACVS